MKADTLREKFLEFFRSKKHRIVSSDSLVPADDPTVLFTPAGMNQFKKQFLGQIGDFSRAASSQRCLRTDDLDKVGKTEYHHTFFEMLGNFSFGDYFKPDAIRWAWEFLTEVLAIDKERLWVSVYKDDEEAYRIWRNEVKVFSSKIVKLGDKDNFWPAEARAKGPNGPCGPCSEIFFDRGSVVGCKRPGCTPACDCGRFVEVWNLVFTQFNRKEGGGLEPLPKKNIDTGMGLERLAAVMQGVSSNFETDLFTGIIREIRRHCNPQRTKEHQPLYAVSDHIRAIVFSIYDGVLPSNESRGYVVRKLIRKSCLHARFLGINGPFLYTLVPVVAEAMEKPYPELSERREDIAQVILAEEKNFIHTLNTSDALFKEKFKVHASGTLAPEKAGGIAFQLYDTYGIPLELTVEWAKKQGIRVSKEAFTKELHAQKERSKSQSQMQGDVFNRKELDLGIKETKFQGYEDCVSKGKILKIIKDGQEAAKLVKGDAAEIVLDKTVFYGESGGQTGDAGKLCKGKNIFEVTDTKKIGKVIIHKGSVLQGVFKKNDLVSASVDEARRLSIARNHTATHLLQAGLRKVLGSHVRQQGSFVGADKLRFDFTHFQALDKGQLARVEQLVNSYILANADLKVKTLNRKDAKKAGALAFFGEKYEERVRMVTIGDFSFELCAGTHLQKTGSIGLFKITQEGSVASGIRRIEAVTGMSAYELVRKEEEILEEAAGILNVAKEGVVQQLTQRLNRIKELEKQNSAKKYQDIKGSVQNFLEKAQTAGEVRLIAEIVSDADIGMLRNAVDTMRKDLSGSVIALGSVKENKAVLVMGITADLAEKGWDASVLIRSAASVLEGSGGGRKDFAQAGGARPERFAQAFAQLKEEIERRQK
ncbi:MAG: alanine--tRNA ligase [Candidatus Omnitrophica bacterium]|nr:alanine--tRNA ligase [Candidatus Omnitrophota bacterium]